MISRDTHRLYRTSEPELSAQGVKASQEAGKSLTEMGIKFDLMVTSAHKRAILTLKHVRDNYVHSATTPC